MKKPPIYTFHFAVACFCLSIVFACFLVAFALQQEAEMVMIVIVSSMIFAILLISGLVFLLCALNRSKNRVLGVYGERKIMVEYMNNTIEVYNFSTALSNVNYITLVINGYMVDRFGGISNSTLRGRIETSDGEKEIILKSNNIIGTLRLYCDDVMLAKKFMPLG